MNWDIIFDFILVAIIKKIRIFETYLKKMCLYKK